jgi:hypothetical protein
VFERKALDPPLLRLILHGGLLFRAAVALRRLDEALLFSDGVALLVPE